MRKLAVAFGLMLVLALFGTVAFAAQSTGPPLGSAILQKSYSSVITMSRVATCNYDVTLKIDRGMLGELRVVDFEQGSVGENNKIFVLSDQGEIVRYALDCDVGIERRLTHYMGTVADLRRQDTGGAGGIARQRGWRFAARYNT